MSRDTSFYYSFLVLPPRKRHAIIAVWDFCRAVDDAVDEVVPEQEWSGGLTPDARARATLQLAGWRSELDAVYSPPRPQAYHPKTGPITRLFPEFRYIEQEYFLKTGAFPPQHLIVLRRETWEENRWIARSITEAFSAANDCFTAAQKGFPYATPWLEAELEETSAVMGEDFHPYGLARNRAQIDTFAAEAFRLGLTSRRVTVDEYFADYLQGG